MSYGTDGLTFNTLREANLVRQKEVKIYQPSKKWIPAQYMNALIGEIGEAANLIKKFDRGDFTMEEGRQRIADELADAQCYLDMVAHRCGIHLGEATMHKWNEVSRRVEANLYINAEGWHRRTP